MARPKPTAEAKLANFWTFVEKPIDPFACWTWTGFRMPNGYGLVSYRDPRVGRLAHRFAYEHLVARIPNGMQVLHTCDNPPCCRPDHLFLGNDLENQQDSIAKGRNARGAKRGRRTLTPHIVRAIRHAFATMSTKRGRGSKGKPPDFINDLAARYGVSGTTIREIGRRATWTYLD